MTECEKLKEICNKIDYYRAGNKFIFNTVFLFDFN